MTISANQHRCKECVSVNNVQEPTKIFSSRYWNVSLHPESNFFGRTIVTCKRHVTEKDLLNRAENIDFQSVVEKMVLASKVLFGEVVFDVRQDSTHHLSFVLTPKLSDDLQSPVKRKKKDKNIKMETKSLELMRDSIREILVSRKQICKSHLSGCEINEKLAEALKEADTKAQIKALNWALSMLTPYARL